MGIVSSSRKGREFKVVFNDDTLIITNSEGKDIAFPLLWHPKLAQATAAEKEQWTISPDGKKIVWETLGIAIDI